MWGRWGAEMMEIDGHKKKIMSGSRESDFLLNDYKLDLLDCSTRTPVSSTGSMNAISEFRQELPKCQILLIKASQTLCFSGKHGHERPEAV
jgi:hypothetical protein